MNSVVQLACKDLRLLVRDRVGFFFTAGFPLVYCAFFGAVFSQPGERRSAINIAIVDEDTSIESAELVNALSKSKELAAQRMSQQEAHDAVRLGKQAAYVQIPKGFGEASKRIFHGDPAKIMLGMDPSRRAEAGLLQGVITKTLFESLASGFSDPKKMQQNTQGWLTELDKATDIDPTFKAALKLFLPAAVTFIGSQAAAGEGGDGHGAAWQPFVIESQDVQRKRTGPKNAYEIAFPQGIIWGVMGCAAAFGIGLVTERTKGTLLRLRIAPVQQAQILGGKALACFTSVLTVQFAIIIVGYFVFGVRPHSWLLLGLVFVCNAMGFVGIMMFLSVLGRTEQAAGGIGWAVLSLMAMLGGGMLPQAFMPEWLQKINVISPVRWAIQGMDGAIWRGFSFTQIAVPAGVLVAVGCVFFVMGVYAFRWSED